MPDVKAAFNKAKSLTSNAIRSFNVAALSTAVPASILGAFYDFGSSLSKAAGLASNVSAVGGIALACLAAGLATGAGVATFVASTIFVGPKKDELYNRKAVYAGIFTGLAAAGAFTWHLGADDIQKQATESAQATQAPASYEVLPYLRESNMKLASLCPQLPAPPAEQFEPVLLPHMKPTRQNPNPCPIYKAQTFDSK